MHLRGFIYSIRIKGCVVYVWIEIDLFGRAGG